MDMRLPSTLINNPSSFSVIPTCSESFFKEGFQTSWNDKDKKSFWADPKRGQEQE
jgi:hypothetical protein